MTMTHSEVHLAVRNMLAGTTYRGFVVVVESVEVEPGDVMVEWRIAVTGVDPILHFRGRNPNDVLAELRGVLDARRRTDPREAALDAIGEPPSSKGAA